MRYWIVSVLVTLGLIGLALADVNEYLFFAGFVVLQFVVIATAWNILGGYAGYVNFGVPAFVATGGYTALVLFKAWGLPIVVQVLAGALTAGILGLLLGLLTLRLRGIYFSIATIAIVVILETVVANWRYVGGASGMQVSRPEAVAFFDSYTRMLFALMAVMAFAAVSIARHIQGSYFGRGLRALRDSEDAAESTGVPTLRLKLAACVVSGALLGAAGAPMPMYMSFIDPASSFNLSYSVSALAMPIIGGMSHWVGPLIGALLLGSIQQTVTVTISSELNVLVVGVLLVLFVVLAPEGIWGLWKKWKRSSR
ncbi:MAG: branched-chain amino acid ABC transporter permease [Lautropia sp.]